MKPSTSLGTRSNVGIAKPSPAVRQTGNMRCLLVMGGVYRSSVPSGGTQVKYRCRCRGQNFHESLLDLTFLIAATAPKAPMYWYFISRQQPVMTSTAAD